MSICCCSLAGTSACKYCKNNPEAITPPVRRSFTVSTHAEYLPTVDAVEVVRCEECVHCADDYVDTGFGAMPAFTCDLFEGYGVNIKPGHYCSYGERKIND